MRKLLGRVAGLFGTALGIAFFGGVYFIVVWPLSCALRLLGRTPLALDYDKDRTSYWDALVRRDGDRELFHRTFSRKLPLAGRHPTIVGRIVQVLAFVSMLVVGNGLIGRALIPFEPRFKPRVYPTDTAAWKGIEWGPAYWKEYGNAATRFVFHPANVYVHADHKGQFFNVENGVRRSYEQRTLPADALTVWVFGGSAVLGDSARDEYTIPSQLARIAEEHHLALRVVNHGQNGLVSWQEIGLLIELLVTERKPDVAVFYDGFNDVAVQLVDQSKTTFRVMSQESSAQKLEGDSDLFAAYQRNSLLKLPQRMSKFRPLPSRKYSEKEVARLAQASMRTYRASTDLAFALGALHGFRVFSFFQPVGHTKQLRPGEEGPVNLSHPLNQLVYPRLAKLIDPRTIDLERCLDGVANPVFRDEVHPNEVGQRAAAEAIYAYIEPTLLELAAAQQKAAP